MSKAKKSLKVQYGIEITKPWSTEMYNHNDYVSVEMKSNILKKWNKLIYGIDKDRDWELIPDHTMLAILQKSICYSGFGSGFTLGDVDKEFKNELENMPNYLLHESYSYLTSEGRLPRTSFMLIGFEWQKFDYHIIGSQEMMSPFIEKNTIDA